MTPLRLSIIEDGPTVRALLQGYLCSQLEFSCVLVASSVEDFLRQLPDLAASPQLVLLDIGLPGLSGIEALPLLRRHLPEADFVMQTVFDDADRIYQALCAGATGYLLKSTPPAEIKAALLDGAIGGAPMSRAVARKVLGYFKPTPTAPSLPPRAPDARRPGRWPERKAGGRPPRPHAPHGAPLHQAALPQAARAQPRRIGAPDPAGQWVSE